jgi:hypothetical protein
MVSGFEEVVEVRNEEYSPEPPPVTSATIPSTLKSCAALVASIEISGYSSREFLRNGLCTAFLGVDCLRPEKWVTHGAQKTRV